MAKDCFDCDSAPFYNSGRVEDKSIIQRVSGEFVVRACPVCDSAESRPYLEKGSLKLIECLRCGMIYASPVAAEFATGQYYDREGARYYLSPAKLESDYSAVRFERELRLFRRYCQKGAVLDVGCGSGAFLFQLNSKFPGAYRTLGTDVSGGPLDYAESRGVPVRRGNFLEQDFEGKKFEAVTLWAVAEHLLQPKKFLRKIQTLLAPGGFCFVLTPNMGSLAVKLLGARYRYIYRQHLNYFTPRTMAAMVESWFVPVKFRFLHFNPIVIWQDWRNGGAEVSNAERGDLLQRTTTYKQRAGMKPLKVAYKLVERGLAGWRLTDNFAVVLRLRADH